MMEVIVFKNKRWQEIPDQDNPTFDYCFDYQKQEKVRVKECILVCKVANLKETVGESGYSVVYIPSRGEITRKGLFWTLENAIIFADALAIKIPKDK